MASAILSTGIRPEASSSDRSHYGTWVEASATGPSVYLQSKWLFIGSVPSREVREYPVASGLRKMVQSIRLNFLTLLCPANKHIRPAKTQLRSSSQRTKSVVNESDQGTGRFDSAARTKSGPKSSLNLAKVTKPSPILQKIVQKSR
jgi:hypothetical protein